VADGKICGRLERHLDYVAVKQLSVR
jgi:hypothetical protein